MDKSRWEAWISVCWPDRREDARQCAERAFRMTYALANIDDYFTRWTVVPRRKAVPFEPTLAALEQKMLEGRHWNDAIPPRVMEDLGFYIVFQAGATDLSQSIGFHLICGAYAGVGLNTVRMEIPPACPAVTRIVNATKLSEILAVLAQSWDPDWGSVRQCDLVKDYRRLWPDYDGSNPSPGWLTYLSTQRGTVPALPAKYQVIPVKSCGNIVVAVDEYFDPENNEHMQAIDELNGLLSQASLLSPL